MDGLWGSSGLYLVRFREAGVGGAFVGDGVFDRSISLDGDARLDGVAPLNGLTSLKGGGPLIGTGDFRRAQSLGSSSPIE